MDNKKQETKFRYFCHGCTKTAYFTTKTEEGKKVTCPHCGLTQETKLGNFIIVE